MDVVLHGLKDSTPPEGVGLNWSTAHQAGKLIEDGNLKKDTFSLSTTARTPAEPGFARPKQSGVQHPVSRYSKDKRGTRR